MARAIAGYASACLLQSKAHHPQKVGFKKHHNSASKGVLIAPIPSRTVKRGLFDESLLAYLLISKYIDHLPLYRQKKIFEREGISIPSSTLHDNTAAACGILKPLYAALKRELLANLYLQADETGIKVLESEKKGACHLGYSRSNSIHKGVSCTGRWYRSL